MEDSCSRRQTCCNGFIIRSGGDRHPILVYIEILACGLCCRCPATDTLRHLGDASSKDRSGFAEFRYTWGDWQQSRGPGSDSACSVVSGTRRDPDGCNLSGARPLAGYLSASIRLVIKTKQLSRSRACSTWAWSIPSIVTDALYTAVSAGEFLGFFSSRGSSLLHLLHHGLLLTLVQAGRAHS